MNMKHRPTLTTLLCSLLVGGILSSQALALEIAGDIAIVNDYKFRGISQTEGKLAIQGGLTFAGESNVDLVIWGSNVRLPALPANAPAAIPQDRVTDYVATQELDLALSYQIDFSDTSDYGMQLTYVKYYYPGADVLEYDEYIVNFQLKNLQLGTVYSDDYYASDERATVYNLDYSVPLGKQLAIDLHYGLTRGSKTTSGASNLALGTAAKPKTKYQDYSIFLRGSLLLADLAIGYVKTDVNRSDCGQTKNCDSAMVIVLSKSF